MDKTCSEIECKNKILARGLCSKHYLKMYNNLKGKLPPVSRLPRRKWTEGEIGWMGGIIDGEGWIGFRENKSRGYIYVYPALSVAMTDEDTIRRIHKISNLGNVTGPHMGANSTKPFWRWNVSRWRDVIDLCITIKPWLSQRRRKIIERMTEWETNKNRLLLAKV